MSLWCHDVLHMSNQHPELTNYSLACSNSSCKVERKLVHLFFSLLSQPRSGSLLHALPGGSVPLQQTLPQWSKLSHVSCMLFLGDQFHSSKPFPNDPNSLMWVACSSWGISSTPANPSPMIQTLSCELHALPGGSVPLQQTLPQWSKLSHVSCMLFLGDQFHSSKPFPNDPNSLMWVACSPWGISSTPANPSPMIQTLSCELHVGWDVNTKCVIHQTLWVSNSGCLGGWVDSFHVDMVPWGNTLFSCYHQ